MYAIVLLGGLEKRQTGNAHEALYHLEVLKWKKILFLLF